MPILGKQDDIFPADLLENEVLLSSAELFWWCLYTTSRREKDLMRRLLAMEIPFYGPVISKRFRSPAGRMRTSYVPLFPNYVFMLGSGEQRYKAMKTNCIVRYCEVKDRSQLVLDLRQVHSVIQAGVPLTPESRLEPGNLVRVRSGPFKGYEGLVIRREGKTRFLLAIRFLEQGVSMEMDEVLLELR